MLSLPEVTVGRKEEHGVELDRDLECAQDAEHEQRPGDGEDGEPHDVEPEALGDLREREIDRTEGRNIRMRCPRKLSSSLLTLVTIILPHSFCVHAAGSKSLCTMQGASPSRRDSMRICDGRKPVQC